MDIDMEITTMKYFSTLIILALILILSGCFFDTGKITESLNGVTTVTASAIVAREDSLNSAKINRDKQLAIMFDKSGINLKIDYKNYDLAGGGMLVVPMIREVTVREYPRFQQDLPMHPKDHRVWNTVDTGIKAFLAGFGIYQLSSWGQNVNDNAGTRYNGPYSQNSYNPQTTTTAIPIAE
jgi:hypothetical protein